jgi:hypothetical protein
VGTTMRRTFLFAALGVSAALLVGSTVAVAGPDVRGMVLVRGVHTEVSLIKADGTKDAFVVDRGKVTAAPAAATAAQGSSAASPSGSVTLERRDGITVTLALNAATKIRGHIQVGKGAIVFSRAGTAYLVLAPRNEKTAAGHHGNGNGKGRSLAEWMARVNGLFGAVHADVSFIRADGSTNSFTFDRGQVTAVSNTSVTLKRADGPSVTISISATTKVSGKLTVGGRAAVFSKGSAATVIFAAASKASAAHP